MQDCYCICLQGCSACRLCSACAGAVRLLISTIAHAVCVAGSSAKHTACTGGSVHGAVSYTAVHVSMVCVQSDLPMLAGWCCCARGAALLHARSTGVTHPSVLFVCLQVPAGTSKAMVHSACPMYSSACSCCVHVISCDDAKKSKRWPGADGQTT